MTSAAAGPSRRAVEAFTIPVVVLGLMVAGFQGLLTVLPAVGLWLFDDSTFEGVDFTVSADAGDYLRVVVWSLPNLALCLATFAVTAVAVRARLREAPLLPWVCLGVIVLVGVLSLMGLPHWSGAEPVVTSA